MVVLPSSGRGGGRSGGGGRTFTEEDDVTTPGRVGGILVGGGFLRSVDVVVYSCGCEEEGKGGEAGVDVGEKRDFGAGFSAEIEVSI